MQSDEVDLRGMRFNYLTWGPAGGRPLVMLHGFTSHAASWRRLAEALPDRHVFALDQRGHGDSDWAPVYGARHMVADLGAFVDRMGLDRFDLLGLSMGGINALAYASTHPDRIDRLVIIDIGPEISPEGLQRIYAGIQVADVFPTREDAFVLARVANPVPRDEVLRDRVYANLKPANGGFTFKYDVALRNGSAIREDFEADELWKLWESIEAPALLVRGETSDILGPDVAEEMVRRRPNCRLVTIPGAGHSVPLDQPERLAEAVGAFLAGRDAAEEKA
jgi:esterase